MALSKLTLAPDQAGYSVADGKEVISTPLDGGAARYRKDIANASDLVSVQWRISPIEFRYLKTFYKLLIGKGAEAFLLDMYIDSEELTEHECRFVPGSFKLSGQQGKQFTVTAQLEATPIRLSEDEQNDEVDWATLFGEYGAGFETLFPPDESDIDQVITFDIPEALGAIPVQDGLSWHGVSNPPIFEGSIDEVRDKIGILDHARYKQVNCLSGAGAWTITMPHLVGSETVSSYEGTTTPTIAAGVINCTAGYLANVVLSDGTVLSLSENTGNPLDRSGNGNIVTATTGVTAKGDGLSSTHILQGHTPFIVVAGSGEYYDRAASSPTVGFMWELGIDALPVGSQHLCADVSSDRITVEPDGRLRIVRPGAGATFSASAIFLAGRHIYVLVQGATTVDIYVDGAFIEQMTNGAWADMNTPRTLLGADFPTGIGSFSGKVYNMEFDGAKSHPLEGGKLLETVSVPGVVCVNAGSGVPYTGYVPANIDGLGLDAEGNPLEWLGGYLNNNCEVQILQDDAFFSSGGDNFFSDDGGNTAAGRYYEDHDAHASGGLNYYQQFIVSNGRRVLNKGAQYDLNKVFTTNELSKNANWSNRFEP